jgi:hypothetical protein
VRVDGKTNGRQVSFEVPGMAPEAFVEAVRRAIEGMELGARVSLALQGGQLVVSIERFGRSEIRYDLVPMHDGFRALLRSRRVAPLHLAFAADFGKTVVRLVEQVAG